MLEKIEGRREKEVTEDKMVGWHHWLNVHKCEQSLGDSEGQGNLVCGSPWGCKELDTTQQLNDNNRGTDPDFVFVYPFHLSTLFWLPGLALRILLTGRPTVNSLPFLYSWFQPRTSNYRVPIDLPRFSQKQAVIPSTCWPFLICQNVGIIIHFWPCSRPRDLPI